MVEAGVRLEVDQCNSAVHLTDAVDQTFHASAADSHVETSLDGQRPGAGERVVEVARQHLSTGLRPPVHGRQIATCVVPRGERFVHCRAQLGRAGRAHLARLKLVGRGRHSPYLAEAVADGADVEVVQLGKAQRDRRLGLWPP